MGAAVDDKSLDIIFRHARTHHGWQTEAIDDELIKRVYDLAKMGPTSSNCCPIRLVFVKSKEAKEKLKPCLSAGNVEQTMAAPATAIIAYDLDFPKVMTDKKLWHTGGKMFEGKEELIKSTAFRNGSLEGAYFIIAARSLGLDCGPMSGFDNAKVDAAFFKGTQIKSNFLCNLGYGDPSKLFPRDRRLEFSEACRIE